MPTQDAILEMRHITKRFPGVVALDDVNLSVRRGEIHAICGENGAGKSTLMKVLSGVYPHGSYEGQIVFDGAEVRFGGIRQSEDAGIVIVHQELALIPELSIAENIFLGNERSTTGVIDWDTTRREARELMEKVGLVEEPTTKIKDLGVGKQQLVEIAKALAKNVKLLILDEPTAALNENDSQELLRLMDGLRSRGITCIMISHKLGEIEQISDSLTVIRDGKTITTMNREAGFNEDAIIKAMVGRSLESRFPEHEPTIGEVLFEVRDWTVQDPRISDRFSTKHANFTVRAGEIVGFAGLMGAGRTELMRSLFGETYGRKLSGEAFVRGKKVDLSTVRKAIKAGLGYVTEDRKVLGLNLLDSIKRTTVAAALSKISKRGVVDNHLENMVAEDFRARLRTKTPSVDEGVSKLSGGNQQKVVLSKWLFTDPDVLILDEPTRGIDVGAKYEIYGVIQSLADQGKAVIVVSSELPELLGLSDRVYTIFEGAITGELSREDATQENLMRMMTSATPRSASAA
ncbi:MAG: sugar ABC transporter ATP-binding protein [Arthrobacter sp.]|jgi:putative multiple sugar transport system ATP-binding protein|nr:sugar ABC transporter ATP-binding protein [Arthrobacter sp.]